MKLKKYYQNNQKSLFFLITLSLIGFIAGVIFVCYLSKNDQIIIQNYIHSFMKSISEKKLDYSETLQNNLISNISFVVIVWILGISVIGIPINIISYFTKSFIMGFSLATFILKYKSTGIIYSICYILPHHLINFILYTFLMIYALQFSSILLYSILNKKEVNFKLIINEYFKVFLICLFGAIFTALLETYFMPFLFSKMFYLFKL